jgi:hypothetical protein
MRSAQRCYFSKVLRGLYIAGKIRLHPPPPGPWAPVLAAPPARVGQDVRALVRASERGAREETPNDNR